MNCHGRSNEGKRIGLGDEEEDEDEATGRRFISDMLAIAALIL